jgi:hypothetical protein
VRPRFDHIDVRRNYRRGSLRIRARFADLRGRPCLLVRFVWYNLNNGVVTTSRFTFGLPMDRDLGFSLLSIYPGIRLYPVENMEASEGMDSRKRQ